MGVDRINPAQNASAPYLAPKELREWLASGKEFTLLDTRNDYEIRLGTFKNAVDMQLDTFRNFPQIASKYIQAHPELFQRPVVSFCTGGIRCEKAAPLLLEMGVKDVYQLEGGILQYFMDTDGEGYENDCYVFDRRVSLNRHLKPSTSVRMCFQCRQPVHLTPTPPQQQVEAETKDATENQQQQFEGQHEKEQQQQIEVEKNEVKERKLQAEGRRSRQVPPNKMEIDSSLQCPFCSAFKVSASSFASLSSSVRKQSSL